MIPGIVKRSLYALVLIPLICGCSDDSSVDPWVEPSPFFSETYSFGKVTVFNDAAYTPDTHRIVAVGFRDSLGNGDKEPVIATVLSGGKVEYKEILTNTSVTQINNVIFDDATSSYVAAGEGPTSEQTFYRLAAGDSVLQKYRIAYRGTTVHPTAIHAVGDGHTAIAGWIEESGKEMGFVLTVDEGANIVWSQYFEIPGMSVRASSFTTDDSGYVVGCACRPVGGSSDSSSSKLVLLNNTGVIRKIVDIAIPRFSIKDLEVKHLRYPDNPEYTAVNDTGYSIVGLISDGSGGTVNGYIGIIDLDGKEVWSGDLGSDSEYSPFRIIDVWSHYFIAGNIGNTELVFTLEMRSVGYELVGGFHSSKQVILKSYRLSGYRWLQCRVVDFTIGVDGEFTEAVAQLVG